MVTQIRVNPSDCQAILDVLQACNINPYDGRSFAQCTSMALSALIGMARSAGALPEVDEFQYLNRMEHFLDGKNNKKKVHMAQTMLTDRIKGKTVTLEITGNPQLEMYHKMNTAMQPEHHPGTQRAQAHAEPEPRSGPQPCEGLDEATREELSAEYIALNDRLNDGDKLTDAEQQRYNFLNKVLF